MSWKFNYQCGICNSRDYVSAMCSRFTASKFDVNCNFLSANDSTGVYYFIANSEHADYAGEMQQYGEMFNSSSSGSSSSSSRTDRWVHFQQNAGQRLYTLELCTASLIATSCWKPKKLCF